MMKVRINGEVIETKDLLEIITENGDEYLIREDGKSVNKRYEKLGSNHLTVFSKNKLLCINALNGSGGGHITMFQLEHGVNK
jgi:hypothetical protein